MTSERFVTRTKRSREHMLSFMPALLFFVVVYSAIAQSPPHLTAEQEAVASRLEGILIAPCCFVNTVAEHRSPISDEIRDQIRVAVASGKTETEILDAFVAKFGERILAAPKPQGFNLLAYILPLVAFAAGLVVVALTLRHYRPRRDQPNAIPPATSTALRARMEAELATRGRVDARRKSCVPRLCGVDRDPRRPAAGGDRQSVLPRAALISRAILRYAVPIP